MCASICRILSGEVLLWGSCLPLLSGLGEKLGALLPFAIAILNFFQLYIECLKKHFTDAMSMSIIRKFVYARMLTAGQFYSGPFHVQFVYKSTNVVSLFINVSKFPKFFTKYFPTIFINFFKTSESTVITWLLWRFSRYNLTFSGQILLA